MKGSKVVLRMKRRRASQDCRWPVGTSWPAPRPRGLGGGAALGKNPIASPGSRSLLREPDVAGKLCYRLAASAPPTTVMFIGRDGMPLATTSSLLSPVSRSVGTSKKVETMAAPVATPIVLN